MLDQNEMASNKITGANAGGRR
jgi:hypothetical protein